jgi:hypothetical protein
MTALSHPDRLAATLANLEAARIVRPGSGFAAPGDGAADCRIDQKLLQFRALRAAMQSPAAAAHLQPFAAKEHPDLWAGTVRDGVARGFAARLEEAVHLAPHATEHEDDPSDVTVVTGKDLRRKKDLLIASAGPRVRFTQKGGVLFVDRSERVHSTNCLWFDAHRDVGSLDGFVPAPGERARLFSAQFLRPARYELGRDSARLLLTGRLGRGPVGWPCEVEVGGRHDAPALRLTIRLLATVPGWRLRVRFLGLPPALVQHDCTPVREVVHGDGRHFVADTLVRACTTLLVDGAKVAVPAAGCPGPIEHHFRLADSNAP